MVDTLDKFVMYLEAEGGLALNTVLAYVSDVKDLKLWLHQTQAKQWDEASTEDLRAYLRDLTSRGASTETVRRRVVSFRSFYKVNGSDIARDLDLPKREQMLPLVLSEAQIGAMIEGAETPRDKALLKLMYASGCRISEIVGLTWANVNLRTREAYVWGKGDRPRIVPMTQEAADALVCLRAANSARPKDRIFPISRQTAGQIVARRARKSGIILRVAPHMLRHACASHLLQNGADLRVIQEILGHSSVATTGRYIHTDVKRLKAIHAKFHPRG